MRVAVVYTRHVFIQVVIVYTRYVYIRAIVTHNTSPLFMRVDTEFRVYSLRVYTGYYYVQYQPFIYEGCRRISCVSVMCVYRFLLCTIPVLYLCGLP